MKGLSKEADALLTILHRLGGDSLGSLEEVSEAQNQEKAASGLVFAHVEYLEERAVQEFVYNLVQRELGRTDKGKLLLELYKKYCSK